MPNNKFGPPPLGRLRSSAAENTARSSPSNKATPHTAFTSIGAICSNLHDVQERYRGWVFRYRSSPLGSRVVASERPPMRYPVVEIPAEIAADLAARGGSPFTLY